MEYMEYIKSMHVRLVPFDQRGSKTSSLDHIIIIIWKEVYSYDITLVPSATSSARDILYSTGKLAASWAVTV
jgi:hypothetical protein